MTNLAPHDSEQELRHLRQLRDAVLDVLNDIGLTEQQKFEAIEALFFQERNGEVEQADEEEEEEEERDKERLS